MNRNCNPCDDRLSFESRERTVGNNFDQFCQSGLMLSSRLAHRSGVSSIDGVEGGSDVAGPNGSHRDGRGLRDV